MNNNILSEYDNLIIILKQLQINIINKLKNKYITYDNYLLYSKKILLLIKQLNKILIKNVDIINNNNYDQYFQYNYFTDIIDKIINLGEIIGNNSINVILLTFNKNHKKLYTNNINEIIEFFNFVTIIQNFFVIDNIDNYKNKKNLLISNEDFLIFEDINNNVNFTSFNIIIKLYNNKRKFILINCYLKNLNLDIIYNISEFKYSFIIQKRKELVTFIKKIKDDNKKPYITLYNKNLLLYELIFFEINELKDNFTKNYHLFNDLKKKKIYDIMIDLNNKKIKSFDKYLYIKLLLISDEKINIKKANILLNIIKENNYLLYQNIFDNINYELYDKLNDKNIIYENNKNELNDKNNLKVLLYLNDNIPEKFKKITLDKINEMNNDNDNSKNILFIKSIINFPWCSDNDNIFFNNLKKNKNKRIKYINNIINNINKVCYGHSKTKEIIIDNICKWISNPNGTGSSLALKGPPGVGKTLLCKSIAQILDIPFICINLGGQSDSDILCGHGFTYSDSQSGLIINKMVEYKKSRCIIYFDELDKVNTKGSTNEIMSVLIHLTDLESNKSFQDRFFQGIEFDLSKVIFLFSYNDSSLIDPILLNRINEIDVESYNVDDKIQICKKFIIPNICKDINFNYKIININDNIIKYIIENYTHEGGVRELKRCIERIILKLNRYKLNNTNIFSKKKNIYEIDMKFINNILGKIYNSLKIKNVNFVGLINGLYATTHGIGGIVPIQITKNYINEQFTFKFTGCQGNIMKESVNCAYTSALMYLNLNHKKYNINDLELHIKNNFSSGFHIHALEGSISKDGPSAGIAFVIAFISIIIDKPIKNNISMTGEIDLFGNILKIGGLNCKLIGAKKAGIINVYISNDNLEDLDEIKCKNNKLFDNNFNVTCIKNVDNIINDVIIFE